MAPRLIPESVFETLTSCLWLSVHRGGTCHSQDLIALMVIGGASRLGQRTCCDCVCAGLPVISNPA